MGRSSGLDFEIAVKTEMIKKELTLKALAKEFGISTAYLSDIVKGNRKAEHIREKIKKRLEI